MRKRYSYTLWLLIVFLLIPINLFSNEIEYSFVPKRVYKKQVFPISFLSRANISGKIIFKFEGDKSPILKHPVIINDGAKIFYTFYFKTDKKLFKIPSVTVNINGKDYKLDGIKIPVEELPKRADFCHGFPPMRSMTGYGRGEALRNGAKFTVEISTVNRRQSELSLHLPRELELLESRVRDEINAKVSRGRITARIGFTNAPTVQNHMNQRASSRKMLLEVF